MANWLTYRIRVGDDVLVLADEEAQELIKNETERSKKADAQTASFLESTTANGIIRNSKSDPFGQTAIGGMKVVIDKGDLIINGNIKNHKRLTRTYNVTQENRTEVFLYRFDSVTNEITGLWRDCIIQGDIILSREDKTELPLRSSGYYDILICKITIPAGATEITQDMIGDFRQNEYYCGYAKNILVDIDETLTKSDAAADAAAVGTVISNLRKETRTRDIITEKRITNLEAGLPAERWSVDDSVAYIKEVPENALPFASVDMVGGMTRRCANLIPYPYHETTKTENGITFKDNGDGTITLNGTATGQANFYFRMYYKLSAGTYHVRGIPNIVGNSVDGCIIYINDLDFKHVATDSGAGSSFTLKEDKQVHIRIIVYKGLSVSNAVVRPMLNEGTEPLPYEPYFDGLRSAPVTEVESVGVNRLGGITFANAIKAAAPEAVISADDKTISYHAAQVNNKVFFADFKPNKQYTIIIKGFGSKVFANMAILYTDGTTESFRQFSAANTVLTLCHKTNATKSVAALVGAWNDGNTTLYYDDCGIFEGVLTEADFVPYRRNTLPVPAEIQALDGYGWGVNDKVYNYIDFEKKQFVKRVGRVDMGTLNWTFGGTDYFSTNLTNYSFPINSPYVAPLLCAKYDTVAQAQRKTGTISGYNQSTSAILVTDSAYTDATTFKAAMAGVMLYYELATPVITDISDLLPDDNLIGVEGSGTVTAVNEYGYDVPSEITYQLKGAEA